MHIFHEAISFIVISAASRNCLQSPDAEPETKDPVKSELGQSPKIRKVIIS